ncbi:MAG: NADH kinase [Rikenellaceae bacterium]|nr:NADH kinase [Rikenellaceae bacterium]
MNIILFSRKQVNHRAQQLSVMLDTIARLGVDYTINEDFASDIEALLGISIDPSHRFSGEIVATGDDVVVTYGGDGTLLEAVGLLPNFTIPVVGINCGRLGYLTVDDGDGIEALLERIVCREVPTEQRGMLRVEGVASDGGRCLALNEVAIHRHGATMITIEALINGNPVATYHGDGLVVSTPTGSTAYSLSAGGPIVDPTCCCFVLSPLAPHNLTMRPIVVPDSNTITLRLHARGGEAFLSADNRTYTLADGATITLRLADERLILATPHNNTFYDTLREKMMWGVDKR